MSKIFLTNYFKLLHATSFTCQFQMLFCNNITVTSFENLQSEFL